MFSYFNIHYIQTDMNIIKIYSIQKKVEHLIFRNGVSMYSLRSILVNFQMDVPRVLYIKIRLDTYI